MCAGLDLEPHALLAHWAQTRLELSLWHDIRRDISRAFDWTLALRVSADSSLEGDDEVQGRPERPGVGLAISGDPAEGQIGTARSRKGTAGLSATNVRQTDGTYKQRPARLLGKVGTSLVVQTISYITDSRHFVRGQIPYGPTAAAIIARP